MNNEAITVIIPTYNGSDLLRAALDSLMTQTYTNFCVLINDDGSDTDEFTSIKGLVDEYSILNITLISNKNNVGCAKNRQRALEYVKQHPTKYITWLDSDDLFLPYTLERLFNFAEQKEADIVIPSFEYYYKDSIEQNITDCDRTQTWLHGKLYNLNFIIDKNLYFCDKFNTNEDLFFNLCAYAKTEKLFLLNENLYISRYNENSITKSKSLSSKNCISNDYLECLYYAYNETENKKIIIVNISELYNHYQNALAFKLLTKEIIGHIKEMLHADGVLKELIQYIKTGELKVQTMVLDNTTILFYAQSFGTWLTSFFTSDEIIKVLKEIE